MFYVGWVIVYWKWGGCWKILTVNFFDCQNCIHVLWISKTIVDSLASPNVV